MNWWGKVLGGAFGMMLGGPLGALLGVALGHNFDKGLTESVTGEARFGKQERIQTLFYTTTFSVMGHVCKADGQVSKDEITLARQVMQQMDLSSDQKQAAMRLFNEGKNPDFPLPEVLEQFRQEIGFRPNLVRMFIEIQITAAYADGAMHPAEQKVLLIVCQHFNISAHEFEHLCVLIAGQNRQQTSDRSDGSPSLQRAYKILDVAETASSAEIKKAYRRLLSQHHPDKLVAKGLPEEMMKVATERTHEIRKAYEVIKQARDF